MQLQGAETVDTLHAIGGKVRLICAFDVRRFQI
jgi:hypothetical protein